MRQIAERPGVWSAAEALAILRKGAVDRAVAQDHDHRRIVDWIQRGQPRREQDQPGADEVYRSVASGGHGESAFVAGVDALRLFGYGNLINRAPTRSQRAYLGLGSPWSIGLPGKGERVVDLGCGSCVDVAIASASVSSVGAVWGIDSRSNLIPSQLPGNVRLSIEAAQHTPIPDGWADLIIANGLPPLLSATEAPEVAREAVRILAPAGSLRAIVIAGDCQEAGDDESLIATRCAGKPLLRELRACLLSEGLAINRKLILPSPYREEAQPIGVDAVLLCAVRREARWSTSR